MLINNKKEMVESYVSLSAAQIQFFSGKSAVTGDQFSGNATVVDGGTRNPY